jgi:uncharacterized protein YegP (UPF0339 family)
MADRNLDEYEPLSFYKKHTKAKDSGFAKFDVEGKYYFCRYVDGDIALLSQAYKAAAGRDNGIESVKKNSKLKERYFIVERDNGKFGISLRAGNRQEVAVSPDYASRKKAETVAGRMNGSVKASKPKKAAPKKAAPKKTAAKKAAVGTAALAAGAAVAKPRNKNDEDNYKPLAFYERQTEGREHGIESFKGDDGLYYFAYFENDKIVLISEGYPTTAARDTGVASVEKNVKLENRYQYRGPLRNGKYDFKLKAGNGKEIARSVWYGSAAAAAAGAAYLMGTRKRVPAVAPIAAAPIAAAAMAAAPVAAVAKPEPAPIPEPEPEPVVYADEEGGIWGWLKWLLLALLALLALFFLFKACSGPKETAVVTPPPAPKLVACWDGSEAESEAACPASVTCWDNSLATSQAACPVQTFTCWDGSSVTDLNTCPAEPEPERLETELTPPAAPTPEIEVAPEPAPEPVRVSPVRAAVAATGLRTIFSPGAGEEAVLIKRLGTNPEFGDSHSLTPDGFCGKLASRYATSGYDASYLDYIAREMGYGGFNEIPSSACSNATIPNGSRGMLGYGAQHAYQYAELNVTDPRDLEAFRIRSLNGKDIYFMKTCGNYFYITG